MRTFVFLLATLAFMSSVKSQTDIYDIILQFLDALTKIQSDAESMLNSTVYAADEALTEIQITIGDNPVAQGCYDTAKSYYDNELAILVNASRQVIQQVFNSVSENVSALLVDHENANATDQPDILSQIDALYDSIPDTSNQTLSAISGYENTFSINVNDSYNTLQSCISEDWNKFDG